MLRQVWHVLVALLLLNLLKNTQGESTTVSSPTVVKETTEKSNETISTNSTITVETTTIVSNLTTIVNVSEPAPTTVVPESTTITNVSESASTTVVPESTTVANVSESTTIANVSESTPTTVVPESTTITNVSESASTTVVPESTTVANVSESTTIANVSESTPTTVVPESTTITNVSESASTTVVPESTTIVHVSESSTMIVNVSESVSTTVVPESTTIANVSEFPEPKITKSFDNQTIENSTVNVSETFTTESLKFNSTVDNTTNVVNASTDIKSHDAKDYFPHAGKPQWTQIESSKSTLGQTDATSATNEFIKQIIPLVAEYIKSQTNIDLTDLIVEQLKNKLDQNELNINDDDIKALRGTVKVILKNLPFIIQTIVSNIDKVGEENCPVKFTFYNSVYCIKFELNAASSLTSSTTQSSSETTITTTTDSLANVSIESFKVFNAERIDKPPTTWQQWITPPSAQDQISSTDNEPVVVCYYTNWAQYRNGPGRFYPENIDPNLCTHINYAFAQLTNGVIAPYEWNDESTQWSTGMFARMLNLRKGNRPKILLALGGWNHGSGKFSDMAQDDTKRATFITTTIIFLQKHNFDGLDLDWEYPGSRDGSRPTDKDDYTKLIVELKAAFRSYSLLLTAAVGAGKPTIDAAYDIPTVCENLDLVNLMSYDLHGSWETETGIHNALFSRQSDTEQNKQLTVDWAVRYWLNQGCSPSKLVLGLATYGRTFRLASSLNNQIGAPAVGPGSAGLYTGEAGFLAYYEICTRIQQQSWTKVFDEEQKSNYAYRGVEWVGFDDAYSLSFKVKYAKDMGLAGIMFWAPDLDDFTGESCNEGKYPLMNAAVNLLRGQTTSIITTQSSTMSTTQTSTQPTFQDKKRVVCYYTNWAQYRPEGGKFVPENLDASLCTHLIYAFAVLKDSKLAPFEWNDEDTDWSKGMYSRIIELKKTNSNNMKVSLAVGGWNFGSGLFSDMVADEKLRKDFVQQATQFIRDHGFDGLDLDWEYPGSREGSRSQDKQLFTTLVKELKAAFQPYNLLLTAAVGAGAPTINSAYEIDKLASYLDFINLMTYDLHGGGWENVTGLHTALYARPDEDEEHMTLNQNWAVNYWIQQGMPKEKITMGLATYGRTFQLVNSSNTGIGAPSSGPGEPGKYTREQGFLSYYEICDKLNSGLWTSKYDDVQKSMYAYGEGMWVGYDNIDTLTIRANYIIGKNLGGVMIWAPDLDDFSGKFCNQGQYPLMNTVVNLVRTGISVPINIPTDSSSTITQSATTFTTATITQSATTFTTQTMTASTPSIVPPPSVHVTSPSVVCMTTINPFLFQTIDVTLCSHLILVQTETNTDIFQSTLSSDTLEELKTMKKTNEKLKIFYSILGQWKSEHLNLIHNDQLRQKFNQQIKQYLIDNQLDGFDIDWNIQADQITSLTDKYYLSIWLSELRNAFISNDLSLSIGISADKTVLDNSYEFNKISSMVDFIRLMAFDWPSKNITSLINPLFSINNDLSNNINWAINYVITLGMPPEQISLGIPTYGRLYGLADSNQHTIGSPVVGSSLAVAYSDICKLLKNTDYIKEYNKPTRSSYTYNLKKKQWISSDTINDVALKASFAKLQGLGGVTLSSIVMDDVDGQCRQGPYPILHAVSNILNVNTHTSSIDKEIENNNPSYQIKQKNIFCSVSSPTEEYSDTIRFFTWDKIDVHLCTHLLIDNYNSLFTSSIFDQLKLNNSNLKILLTFNGNENENNIEQWKEEINKKKIDGINILINSNKFSDKITQLIKTIRTILSNEQLFTISFQLPSDPSQQISFFHVLELHKFVDYMFILPFDEISIKNYTQIQHWNTLATFVPMDPTNNIGDFSIISILMFILSAGVPKEKLILSIPTYGLSFILENENNYKIGDKILGQGFPGRISNRTGFLASYEICELVESDNYKRFLSNESITVVAHEKKNFIIFDDTQPLQLTDKLIMNGTVELKATFIKNAQLSGVLVHLIDKDDYTGEGCHRGKYPITSIVARVFSTSTPSMPPSWTTATATTSSTPTVEKSNLCAGVTTKDLIADENDCQYYYVCMPSHQQPIAHLQCPNNMHFSPKQKACSQEYFPCSSKSKFNTINKTKPSTEVQSSKSEIPFICPTPTGIFPDPSDCTRFFACSNNLVAPMNCPLKTKFNPESNQCDWTSSSCP